MTAATVDRAADVETDQIRPTVPNVWRLGWRVTQHRPKEYWLGGGLFLVFFTMPALTGYLLSRGYNALAEGNTGLTYKIAAAVAVSEIIRMVAVHSGAILWTKVWVHIQTLLRANMLVAQMASGGPEAGQPVGSAGAAITHFRDDTEDVAEFIDIQIDVTGGLIFTAIAGFVLGSADPRAAAILILPLVAVAVVTRALDDRIRHYRSADRIVAGEVTGFVGDTMAAATTVKVNDAASSILARLGTLVHRRQETAVRDRVLDEGVQAFGHGAADVGLGLVLVVSAGAIASGAFEVGTLALFAAYLGWLSFLPRMVGRLLARRKYAAVAFERMGTLVADGDVDRTVGPRDLPIDRRDIRERPNASRPDRVPLEEIQIRGLGARYANGRGVSGVSFTVRRGDFVVITGPIGAGKSTLLRAILGLAWQTETEGEILWNGQPIADRAAFMVPPNAAFLSQVPQLISDSVGDNVALGQIAPTDLHTALELAAVWSDIDELPEGTDTLIGPRGLRLSGGQRQRLATARALVHRPELVVLDDLSSALDVETELILWENLRTAGMTVVAVSHRAVAFDRASQVLRMDNGRLTQTSS